MSTRTDQPETEVSDLIAAMGGPAWSISERIVHGPRHAREGALAREAREAKALVAHFAADVRGTTLAIAASAPEFRAGLESALDEAAAAHRKAMARLRRAHGALAVAAGIALLPLVFAAALAVAVAMAAARDVAALDPRRAIASKLHGLVHTALVAARLTTANAIAPTGATG